MVNQEMIVERLRQLGYVATSEDDSQIEFELEKIIRQAKNYCHIDEVPEILDYRIVDRVCGEFLYYKKNAGQLNDFDYDAVIKSIREGDTTVTYAVGQGEDTPENRFDAFVKKLELGFNKELTRYRRLIW